MTTTITVEGMSCEHPGHMGHVTVDFLADNPGDWLFHCHNIYHLDGGMARIIEYVD